MINNKQMKYITDRACYNVLIDFRVAVIIEPSTFRIRKTPKLIKETMLDTMNLHKKFGISVPYLQIKTLNVSITETLEEQPDNILTIYADCNTEMCYEDCDNEPQKSASGIIEGFLHSIGGDNEYIKSASAFDISVKSPIKGYIQADNTIYYPNPL
jgi:hypothetical protein